MSGPGFSDQFHRLPQFFDSQFHPLTSASSSMDIQSRNLAQFQLIASVDAHLCGAFLPNVPLTLKALRSKEYSETPQTLGVSFQ